MLKEVNWVGLAGGVSTLVLITVSLFTPWWQFKIGNPEFVQADLSPVNTTIEGMGSTFTIPLIWALNVASLLSLAAGGAVMLAYSLRPAKPYSNKLLRFAYNKPLLSVAFFAVSLLALTLAVRGILGFDLPLMGSASVKFPESMTMGTSVSVLVSAGFLWPFWLAVVTAGLCLAARFYHRRVGGVFAQGLSVSGS